jgi:hypothetical protein
MLMLMRLKSSLLSFFLVILIYITGCANQQLQLGVNAYKQGKYDIAASHWNDLAKNGNPYAQYNLGLIWEGGLGSTEKNIKEASLWYLKSARNGYIPAMVRLANIQKANGFEEAAHSWYILAARYGNKDAISALSIWGKTIPQPDLLLQKLERDAKAKQQLTETMSEAAYILGCALSGGDCSIDNSQPTSSSYQETSDGTSSTSVELDDECWSDFNCSRGFKCVKAPLKSRGTCMRSVDEYGVRQYNLPNTNSIGPNLDLDGQCQSPGDCPPGFQCDRTNNACVRR